MALWEHMVKPGIKKLLIDRGKEMKQERIAALNLLMLRQDYLVRKLQSGEFDKLGELKLVQANIQQWHDQECDKIKIQARTD